MLLAKENPDLGGRPGPGEVLGDGVGGCPSGFLNSIPSDLVSGGDGIGLRL